MTIGKATCLAIAMASLIGVSSGKAADVSFAGKTITVFVSSSTGGNYDLIARLLSRHIGKYIPGTPSIVVANMPGAGGLRAANYLYNVAARDGTALGVLSATIASEEALGTPGIQYRAANFSWIGRVSSVLQPLVTLEPSRTKQISDAYLYETPMAGTGIGSPSEGYPRLLNGLIGTKFKVVSGYNSSADATLAMDRGEVDGVLPSWTILKRTYPKWVSEKRIHPLVQFLLKRSPELPDTPTVGELAKSSLQKEVLEFYTSGEEMGRYLVAPPEVPRDRLEAIQAAFEKALKDSEFQDEVRRLQIEFNPLPAAELRALVVKTTNAAPETIELTKKILAHQ